MKIKCPACEFFLSIPPGAAGKVVKCPCGKQLRAPAAPATAGGTQPSAPSPDPMTPVSGERNPAPNASGEGGTDSSLFGDLPGPATNSFSQQAGPYSLPASASGGKPVGVPQPAHGGGQVHPVAIVSLILGILSLTIGCCCWLHVPLGIGAAVTGGFGISYGNQGRGGKGMAIAGLVMGIIALVVYSVLAVVGIAFNLANMQNGQFNQ